MFEEVCCHIILSSSALCLIWLVLKYTFIAIHQMQLFIMIFCEHLCVAVLLSIGNLFALNLIDLCWALIFLFWWCSYFLPYWWIAIDYNTSMSIVLSDLLHPSSVVDLMSWPCKGANKSTTKINRWVRNINQINSIHNGPCICKQKKHFKISPEFVLLLEFNVIGLGVPCGFLTL